MNENDVLAAAVAAWLTVQLTRLVIAARAKRRAELARAVKEARAAKEIQS